MLTLAIATAILAAIVVFMYASLVFIDAVDRLADKICDRRFDKAVKQALDIVKDRT